MSDSTRDPDDPYVTIVTNVIPQVQLVRLYKSTWDGHILVEHSEVGVVGQEAIMDAIANPTSIHASVTRPDSAFVYLTDGTTLAGHPLAVPVTLVNGISARVSTALFSSSYLNHAVVWKKYGGTDES